jgi:hypothetical protein
MNRLYLYQLRITNYELRPDCGHTADAGRNS